MRFEKLNEDKIRITFNLEDLKEKNVNFHDFMSNSIETQTIFLDMLTKAEKEIGFVTNNYKLMIEALATSDGNFMLTVTRSLPETSRISPRKIRAKRKVLSENLPVLVYKFQTFDDFCNLCNCLDISVLERLTKVFKQSSLNLYNNSYYLVLKSNLKANLNDLKYTLSTVSEFSTIVKDSSIFERKLNEYGKVIIKDKCFLKINK